MCCRWNHSQQLHVHPFDKPQHGSLADDSIFYQPTASHGKCIAVAWLDAMPLIWQYASVFIITAAHNLLELYLFYTGEFEVPTPSTIESQGRSRQDV